MSLFNKNEHHRKRTSIIGMLIIIAFFSYGSPALAQDIVINELMADNEVSVQDPSGEYDDWLELYNNSDITVDLSGWHMSDDENELNEWAFPEGTTIEADGYLIVWCDEDLEQDGLHADFKLSSGGETVYLSTSGLEIMQAITYEEATMDESFSRVPNGTGDFVWQEHTYNGPNSTTGISDPGQEASAFLCYPVPARDYLTIEHGSYENETIKIYSLSGELIWAGSITSPYKINVQSWPKGMYILSNESGLRNKIIIQ